MVRAQKANLADLSDVALLKRLRKSKDWLHALCVRLFREQGMAVSADGGFQIRALDATTVQEPGKGLSKNNLYKFHVDGRMV